MEEESHFGYFTRQVTKREVEEKRGALHKCNTPLPVENCHPEMDDSPLLGENDHRFFQMLIGMGMWLVVLGRLDLCFAMCSLSRFGASPRELHLRLAIQSFSYLKKFPDKRIAIDSGDIDFSSLIEETHCDNFQADFLVLKGFFKCFILCVI